MPVDHYENFPVASLLVPARLRRPIEVIYRFARSADDIADEGEATADERLRDLAVYRAELDRIAAGQTPEKPLFRNLAEVIAEFSLLADLLSAFEQDVRMTAAQTRYTDMAHLLDYCRRSANPVGRLVLHLFGRTEPEHLEQSDCICTALQLINFWQDVAVDWQKERVYIPQTDFPHFRVGEADIAAGRVSPDWSALLERRLPHQRGTP